MNSYVPYQCIHLNLAIASAWQVPQYDVQGRYIVLWWNQTPIGHLFLKPGEELSHAIVEQKIIHAASWALQHYSKNSTDTAKTPSDVERIFAQAFSTQPDLPDTCDVSVVICTKDRAPSLQKCLESLMNLQCKPAEIIVVDNASADDCTRKTVNAFSGVRYLREDRLGLDIARNTGARAATQSIILYTDDDTAIYPLWVYHAYRTFEDQTVAAMTGLVLAAELRTEGQWIFERFWPFNRGFIDKRYDYDFFTSSLPKGPPVWTIGAGANMAFRKSIFDVVGYFDERLDVGAAGCNGDSEMWYRILAAGYSVHYNPRAVVSHFHRTAISDLKHQIFYYMRGFTAAILFQYKQFKHPGNLKHLFREIPKYYCWVLLRGFPLYKGRYKTIFVEMKGLFSGLLFYLQNKNTSSNSGMTGSSQQTESK